MKFLTTKKYDHKNNNYIINICLSLHFDIKKFNVDLSEMQIYKILRVIL